MYILSRHRLLSLPEPDSLTYLLPTSDLALGPSAYTALSLVGTPSLNPTQCNMQQTRFAEAPSPVIYPTLTPVIIAADHRFQRQ